MACEPIDPSLTDEYKGRTISLRASITADGAWHCRYLFIQFTPIFSAYISSYPDGSFATRHEAEVAALARAKQLIDKG